jgi:hypothetical protein
MRMNSGITVRPYLENTFHSSVPSMPVAAFQLST